MNNNVTVNRQTAITSSTVTTANKTFRFDAEKSGVVLSQGKNSFTIPNGAAGRAILAELGAILGAENGGVAEPKVRRTRRTKAEIEAARAAEEALNSEVDNLLSA